MAFLIDTGVTIVCPHNPSAIPPPANSEGVGVVASITTTNTSVFIRGNPVLRITIPVPQGNMEDNFLIVGCTHVPHPCIRIKWISSAFSVKVKGKLVLLQDSIGICQYYETTSNTYIDQDPNNIATVIRTQSLVKGT
jgi:hypothetical protein